MVRAASPRPVCLSVAAGLLSAFASAALADDARKTEIPSTPAAALAALKLPEGFAATLFAAEPEITQPIALATDSKGRLWVAENQTYSERAVNFDLGRHDRIVILEDTDHDGRADRRKVFWDRAQRLTSVEVGFGGVWALCPPNLLFLPDRDGDDVPDGEPEVVLDGWDGDSVRHNIANGLRWGPDGWLYGRHGILATSHVGLPGTPPGSRTALNCAIWRFHPVRRTFEVVCRGTTNPWGMDWDDRGELFFINTVIGHLWHALPGAHFQRMYGEDDDPHLYRLLGQTADHFHWDTADSWKEVGKGVSAATDRAGGGHAHAGLMIYLGDNWPDAYRGSVFAVNLHGRRLNRDTLERRGAGFVGRHAPDFARSSDPWFRAVELLSGPDGGAYLADWSDVGECHENDAVHRESGRIFKITYGTPRRPEVADVAALDDEALVKLLGHRNDWYVRQARRVLQERAASGKPMAAVHGALRAAFARGPDAGRSLRALWALATTGGTDEGWLLRQLDHPDEAVRVWAVRLLTDSGPPSAAALKAFTARAAVDPSGLVLAYLASSLRTIPASDRWPLAEALAARGECADDPVLPRMVWYGLEPAVPGEPSRAVALAGSTRLPEVAQLLARRLTEGRAEAPAAFDALVTRAAECPSADRQRALLAGMAEALRGWRQAPAPPAWGKAAAALAGSPDEGVRRLARNLSVVFGDGRALDELRTLAASQSEDPAARRDAIRALVEARSAGLTPLLRGLIDERGVGPEAIRGLAAFGDRETPGVLLAAYPRLRAESRAEAIATLASRPASALALLDAVDRGVVARGDVDAFQRRRLRAHDDAEVRRRVGRIWPEADPAPSRGREEVARRKAGLGPEALGRGDAGRGKRLFTKACATCHTLFGEGGAVGPDLTGSQRSSLDYLLENIVTPDATLAPDYRMSIIALADGRVVDGIVTARTGPTLTVKTPGGRLVLRQEDIEDVRETGRSLMPEGLLDALSDAEVRDLIVYLMSSRPPVP